VFSPIALQEFDAQKYREFVRALSDEALIKEGKKLRWLSGDGKIVSTTPSAFDAQLKICRAEWRRAAPKIVIYTEMLSPEPHQPNVLLRGVPFRDALQSLLEQYAQPALEWRCLEDKTFVVIPTRRAVRPQR